MWEGSRRGTGSGVEETLQQGGIFTDIDEESFGSPASGSLDDGRGDTVFSEGSGSSCSHRLASHIALKEEAQAVDEK